MLWPISKGNFVDLFVDVGEPSSGNRVFHGVEDVEWAVDDFSEGFEFLSPVCKLGVWRDGAVVAHMNYAWFDLFVVSL